MTPILDVREWVDRTAKRVAAFYEQGPAALTSSASDPLEQTLVDLLLHNATLWGHEDECRRSDLPDQDIAQYKRLIDKENQQRNDAIDRIDGFLRERLTDLAAEADDAPLNTETPASAFDRITIMLLRSHHLGIEVHRDDATPEHGHECDIKLHEVRERIDDLARSLQDLLDDITAGRKRMKRYNMHKLYNDPETNPAVRQARKG